MDKNIELILREYKNVYLECSVAALDQGISHIHKCKWSTVCPTGATDETYDDIIPADFPPPPFPNRLQSGHSFSFYHCFFFLYYFSKRMC